MNQTINQLQKGMSKLQVLVEDINKSRKEARIKEQMLNENERVLLNMMNDKRSLNEIVDSIEKSVMERSVNYEMMLNEIKEGRLA